MTRRITLNQRRLFSGLGIGLVTLVAIILVSAFQRLLLLEAAYGFSRLRTYPHVFMIWLGILLAATVALEIANRQRAFAIAALAACLGFGLTLNVLNVDDYIVRQNVARAEAGGDLDTAYFFTLSDDAIPSMFQAFDTTRSTKVRDELGSTLACRQFIKGDQEQSAAWQSFHWAASRANMLFQSHAELLKAYPVSKDESSGWLVTVNGATQNCYSYGGMMD